MKSPYVNDLQPDTLITGKFLVQNKEIRHRKSGEPYLWLTLSDRTGEIEARMWDNAAEVLDAFERDDVVQVKSFVQIHQKRPQLTLQSLVRVKDSEVDPADYFPVSARDRDEMFAELRRIVAGMENRHLRGLLDAILDDPEIARRYRIAPAAKAIHHAYLGGLLEHVLSVCHLCRMMAAHYRHLDLDLLLAGAVLHDIGKIGELSYDRSFRYSDEGQLLGHIVMALGMIDDKLRGLPDFPAKLRTLLQHMLISHHGELEFGSPKIPLFAEALMLHYLDNLDSKMETMRALAEKDKNLDGCWTGYSAALERSILRTGKFLDGTPAATPGAAPGAPVPAPPPQQKTASAFAEKLQGALKKEP